MIYGTHKGCSKCRKTRPIDDFYLDARGFRQAWCNECKNQLARDRKTATPDDWRRYKLKQLYGITVEDYDALEEAQDGRCAVCGRPETRLGSHGEVKRLAVDHDHATGHTRGLLCMNCNLAVGLLEDDDQLAEALMEYVRKWRRKAIDGTDSAAEPRLLNSPPG